MAAVTGHIFVHEVVHSHLNDPPTSLETACEIAVLDVVDSLSAFEARRAVLAVHAAMAWFKVTEAPDG